jgi:hypothetical protein
MYALDEMRSTPRPSCSAAATARRVRPAGWYGESRMVAAEQEHEVADERRVGVRRREPVLERGAAVRRQSGCRSTGLDASCA